MSTPQEATTGRPDGSAGHHSDLHHAPSETVRRRSAYLYGLVITGSVLAAAPTGLGLVRVAALLGGTLVVYWCAETYAHLIAARTLAGRALTGTERREVATGGLPLVAACAVPVVVLLVEALLQVEPSLAVDVALTVNVGLLVVVGWRMSTAGGLRGARRVLTTAGAGLLGVAMIVLKLSLHH
ncbi:hypothetical protein [Cellulosimicrobium sp. CUA-896]|uniref:hypothetical protein n=1 Tax=Cellulosimicrobium sp. CUA-896 TaxID=1517881 RepID=UPI00095D46FC|nr:hypothetical protein [Cellulosimicrobium sp. CUA-896]OLT48085.1 hypothetical protein BJF88_03785 [Cellulosimicrobium sp. CUA-896]